MEGVLNKVSRVFSPITRSKTTNDGSKVDIFFVGNMAKFQLVVASGLDNGGIAKIHLRCVNMLDIFLVIDGPFNAFGDFRMAHFLVTVNDVHDLLFEILAKHIYKKDKKKNRQNTTLI